MDQVTESGASDVVLDVVRKNTVECLDGAITLDAVTMDKTFKDLGADSIQVVEIISLCMRELKVKIPRSESSKIKDVGALVQALSGAH